MAFEPIFIDGFDHYATADIDKKWSANGSMLITANARTGTGCMESQFGSGYAKKYFSSRYPVAVLGGAWYFPGGAPASQTRYICMLTATGAALALVGGSNGEVSVSRCQRASDNQVYAGTIIGTSSPGVLSGDTWHYIEFRGVIHNTTGEYEVKIDGVSVLSASNVDTDYGGSDTDIAGIAVGVANVTSGRIDDLYVQGDSAVTAGGFLGDCGVHTRYPDGDGTTTTMAPSTGTDHFATVDEASLDEADYNTADATGEKDLYTMTALGESGQIEAVQVSVAMKKAAVGARTAKLLLKSGATEDASGLQLLSTSAKVRHRIDKNDPNTGSAWTTVAFDAIECGVEAAD